MMDSAGAKQKHKMRCFRQQQQKQKETVAALHQNPLNISQIQLLCEISSDYSINSIRFIKLFFFNSKNIYSMNVSFL